MTFLSASLDSSQSNLWSSLWFTLGITGLSLGKQAVDIGGRVQDQKKIILKFSQSLDTSMVSKGFEG